MCGLGYPFQFISMNVFFLAESHLPLQAFSLTYILNMLKKCVSASVRPAHEIRLRQSIITYRFVCPSQLAVI